MQRISNVIALGYWVGRFALLTLLGVAVELLALFAVGLACWSVVYVLFMA